MAKKRILDTKFWTDHFVIDELDPLEKLVYLYLITSPYSNISGVYELSIKVMAVEVGIDKDNLEKAIIPRLQGAGKIMYKDGWVAIKNFIKHQNQGSDKIKTGIRVELAKAPKELCDWLLEGKGMDTLSHLNPNSNSNSNLNSNRGDLRSKTSVEDKIFCKDSPSKKHNFLGIGGDCSWCGANQNEISGRKLKRGFQEVVETTP